MAQLLDVFGFLSVVLRGLTLALQSLTLGGLAFVALAARDADADLSRRCRRWVAWAAVALAATQAAYVAADSAILVGTTGLGLPDVVGAGFFVAGTATCVSALAIALLATRTGRVARAAALLSSIVVLASSVATSHAAARLEDRALLMALTGVHHAATALWVGALPYLLVALTRAAGPAQAGRIASRFSRQAQFGVAAIVVTGGALSVFYVGRPAAAVGTAYGAMVATKVVLFAEVALLGAFNFLVVRRARAGAGAAPGFVCRLTEAEIGIGFTVILAAGSLTSQPPAVDVEPFRIPVAEIAERMRPVWPPRLSAPSPDEVYGDTAVARDAESRGLESFVPGQLSVPITPAEIAFSESNHHWAGVFVLLAGVLATAARAGLRWARHWPWAFLGLGVFLFLMADADYWPLGELSFWRGFTVSEVLQHRLILPLVFALSWFEWRVQTGRAASARAALVFPLMCALGGAVLLTHTHSLNNVKEELLAELSHIPIALLGVTAGWSRWLEVRLGGRGGRVLSWIWPVCLALVGGSLLAYRES